MTPSDQWVGRRHAALGLDRTHGVGWCGAICDAITFPSMLIGASSVQHMARWATRKRTTGPFRRYVCLALFRLGTAVTCRSAPSGSWRKRMCGPSRVTPSDGVGKATCDQPSPWMRPPSTKLLTDSLACPCSRPVCKGADAEVVRCRVRRPFTRSRGRQWATKNARR